MRIYAKVGESKQYIDNLENSTMPEGFDVEMKEQRPESPDPDNYAYIAGDDGLWLLVEDRSNQIINAKQLLADAHKQVEILQDRVDFEDYANDEDLAQLQASIKTWKKYRIELNKFISGQRDDMPQMPG